jgi:hypothetical protein
MANHVTAIRLLTRALYDAITQNASTYATSLKPSGLCRAVIALRTTGAIDPRFPA